MSPADDDEPTSRRAAWQGRLLPRSVALVLSGGELRDDLALLAVGAAASDED